MLVTRLDAVTTQAQLVQRLLGALEGNPVHLKPELHGPRDGLALGVDSHRLPALDGSGLRPPMRRSRTSERAWSAHSTNALVTLAFIASVYGGGAALLPVSRMLTNPSPTTNLFQRPGRTEDTGGVEGGCTSRRWTAFSGSRPASLLDALWGNSSQLLVRLSIATPASTASEGFCKASGTCPQSRSGHELVRGGAVTLSAGALGLVAQPTRSTRAAHTRRCIPGR